MIPKAPVPGLVVRYSYLWNREHQKGQPEGRKNRPAVVVVVVQSRVMVLPITHSPPADAADAVELPAATKQRLGLDGDRSWVMISEGNAFTWPSPDVTDTYGLLPPAVFGVIKARLIARMKDGNLRQVPRVE